MLRYSKQKSFELATSLHTATVKGLLTDHNQGIDLDTGNPVNARNAHASVHEDELIDKGFTSLNIRGAIILDGSKYYKIGQILPNVTTGLIVCILKDCKQSEILEFTENKSIEFTENENIEFTENE